MTETAKPLPLHAALDSLAKGADLSRQTTAEAVGQILDGSAAEPLTAAFLTALRWKGETADELAGAVDAVRSRMVKTGLSISNQGVIDTCGTGGDGANLLNVSTAAAIVVAGSGVKVAKHGNRSASGNSGSAEVLTELGVAIDDTNESISGRFETLGIAFLFAPRFHPGLRFAAPVRKQLPYRTMFNLVGPLANPVGPEFQLVGVAGEAQSRLVAGALAKLGVRRATVVNGSDGLDEITLQGPTSVLLVENGQITPLQWTPADFGFAAKPISTLRVDGPADSARRILGVLNGTNDEAREIVVANAAGAIWTALGGDLKEAVERSIDSIDSGRAAALLKRWIG